MLAAAYNISHVVGKSRLRPCWMHQPSEPPSRAWSVVVGGRTYYYDPSSGAAVEAAAVVPAAGVDADVAGDAPSASLAASEEEGVGLGAAEAEEEGSDETDAELLAGFKWGMAVECSSSDEGLQGCWCPAEVLQAHALPFDRLGIALPTAPRLALTPCLFAPVLQVQVEHGQVLVQWLAEDSDPQNELVPLERIRPAPPPPPAGWVASLRVGEPCDVHYDGAWWEVTLEARHGEKLKARRPTNHAAAETSASETLRPP